MSIEKIENFIDTDALKVAEEKVEQYQKWWIDGCHEIRTVKKKLAELEELNGNLMKYILTIKNN